MPAVSPNPSTAAPPRVRRGGFVAVAVAVLLQGDAFPGLSLAAVGGWLRLRAVGELTEEPVSEGQAERQGLTPEVLAELTTAGVIVAGHDGRYSAVGMPRPSRKPSDEPEATRERQARHREQERQSDFADE